MTARTDTPAARALSVEPAAHLVFAVAIGILHLACRWFAGLKAGRRDWWLRYL